MASTRWPEKPPPHAAGEGQAAARREQGRSQGQARNGAPKPIEPARPVTGAGRTWQRRARTSSEKELSLGAAGPWGIRSVYSNGRRSAPQKPLGMPKGQTWCPHGHAQDPGTGPGPASPEHLGDAEHSTQVTDLTGMSGALLSAGGKP